MALRLSEGLGRTACTVAREEFLACTLRCFPVSADARAGAVLRRCGARNQQSVSRSESRPRSAIVEWWHDVTKYCIKRQES